MFNLNLKEVEKFGFVFNEQKYSKVLQWYKNVEEIVLKNDREKLKLLQELEKEIYQAKITWLKHNKNNIYYSIDFEDAGYAFVDILKIYDENDNVVYQAEFMGEGQAEEFINEIMQ
jgi:hypothetical protein